VEGKEEDSKRDALAEEGREKVEGCIDICVFHEVCYERKRGKLALGRRERKENDGNKLVHRRILIQLAILSTPVVTSCKNRSQGRSVKKRLISI